MRKVDELQENQSGWSLSETLNLAVNISRYTPLQAGISTFVAVPEDIRRTEGVVNIINKDHYCFLWCVVAALYPVKAHRNLPSSYPYPSSVLDHTGITFPMELKNIPSFEKMNDLRINVYGIEPKENEEDPSVIVPLYLSSNLESAHNSCNLNFQQSHIIPIVFHNLSGYDCHFILESVATVFNGSLEILPINKEKYIAFTKTVDDTNIHLRFIDSFRFMASSIDKLSSYLTDD
ncbi:GSCOCG00012667001-RA-CDS, partial [Cotesia congregata]